MDNLLKCPFCDNEYVHIINVMVNQGGLIAIITNGEIRSIKGGMPELRGSSIRMEYLGECGHQWVSTQDFHKGNVFVETTLLKSDVELSLDFDELWRD